MKEFQNYKYKLKDAEDIEQYLDEVGVKNEEVITGDYKKLFVGNHDNTWRLRGKGELHLFYGESAVKENWEIEGDFVIYSTITPENFAYLKRNVTVKKGKVEFRTIVLGGFAKVVSNYYTYDWVEERGIVFLNGDEVSEMETLLSHEGEKSHSYSHIRGILNDKAYASIKGLIWIKPQAKNSNSYLDQHVVLLSEDSWAFTWPALRIENNEVKASHSATISKIPEEMIFYLASRGLSRKDAMELLIKGFTHSVFDPPEELWDKIKTKL